MNVQLFEEEIEIPTYEIGPPDPNPMFLEKRVYQGSSGKVYPWPVIDEVGDTKVTKKWTMVVLENQWLRIWILPALGGRVHRAFDKTNGYDFVYFNQVIKPALVGLAGPWISGGIEFNWPQHHRPSTYSPVEYMLRDNEDGSKSVVVSEVDRMYGTKGEAVFTLRPDRAVLEIQGRLYNPTPFPQTFLWWANPAVAVNDHTQTIFPPDVTAVFDHGKRDTSRFPIATGTYYKTDYSAGVDISRYKNIPVPTSYMAWKSDYDFVGGYDHEKKAGLLHVADHHVSPGKKQWTWGHGEFGRAWDRNLTDEDGPYIELMTGVFTDNQPDFTWLAPHEEKTFAQNFLPYKGVGEVKNANVDAAVGLAVDDGRLQAGLYVTAIRKGLRVVVAGASKVYADLQFDLGPETPWTFEAPCHEPAEAVRIEVRQADGSLLIDYQAAPPCIQTVPESAKPISAPAELADAEALWLAGQHLEQYRHATFDPEDYYREGLRRSAKDLRLNAALGLLLLRRGQYVEAEALFRTALATLTRHNNTPADGEITFHLGTALEAMGRFKEAGDAWAKAAWSAAWQDSAFFALGRLAARHGDWTQAEAKCRQSLVRNTHNLGNRHLLAAVLRRQGRTKEAQVLVAETLSIDPLDSGALNEGVLSGLTPQSALSSALGSEPRNRLLLATAYASAGLYQEALDCFADKAFAADPMTAYFRASWLEAMGQPEQADRERKRGAGLGPDLVFPNRLEELAVLDETVALNPSDGRAWFYRGNLLYDKKRYALAAESWEKAVAAEPGLATAWRNLALAYFNKLGRPTEALGSLETAFRARPNDARLLMEVDQLTRKLGWTPRARLARLSGFFPLVNKRDDLAVEHFGLLNLVGRHEEALAFGLSRIFHAWEGGEGKVLRQYVRALLGLAYTALAKGDLRNAWELLLRTLELPQSLGEARLPNAKESQLQYTLGLAASLDGRSAEARDWWTKAAAGNEQPAGMMFYNDTPPELIFYQGLARRKLGDETGAVGRFHSLVDYGERHVFDKVKIDYFAVSLPDFVIFEEDLDKRNRVHCRFLIGLGRWGLGDRGLALDLWRQAAAEDPSHQGILDHLGWAESGDLDR
jgi:tetratricopeptide (TPR) repeat protein